MRQSWTDDRLDDLSHRMDERFDHVEGEMKAGFDRIDGDIRGLRAEMKDGFVGVDGDIEGLRGEMKDGFVGVDGDIEGLRGEMKTDSDELGRELRGEIAACEGRIRAQMSENDANVREAMGKLHDGQQQLNTEMLSLQRTIIQIAAGMAGTVVLSVLGVLITKL